MNIQLKESSIKHLSFEEIDSFSKFIIVFQKRKIKGAMQKFIVEFFQSALIWPMLTHFEFFFQSAVT